jgi:hypothetical protein
MTAKSIACLSIVLAKIMTPFTAESRILQKKCKDIERVKKSIGAMCLHQGNYAICGWFGPGGEGLSTSDQTHLTQ